MGLSSKLRTLAVSGVLAGLLALAGTAQAQDLLPPAAFKAPATGTEIKWGDTESSETALIEVGPRDGYTLTWTRNGEEEVAGYTLFCWYCPTDEFELDTGKLDALFPLEVGKSTTFERSRGRERWVDTVSVTGVETVNVPAGRFDVYVVKTESRKTDNSWNGRRVAYYAPNLGWTVKIEWYDGDRVSSAWHVLSIDGETGINASMTAPDEGEKRRQRLFQFAAAEPEPSGPVRRIGEVTGVKTYAYGTVPGRDRAAKFPRYDLFTDELIETVRGSALHAVFADGTDFRMGPDSAVRLDRYLYDPDRGDGEMVVNLGEGVFRFVSGKMAKDAVAIGTPDVTIGIRGTDFIVEVDGQGTRVSVIEGEVEITPNGGGAAVSVGPSSVATANNLGVSASSVASIQVPPSLTPGGCGG
jgi:hypothetical protein